MIKNLDNYFSDWTHINASSEICGWMPEVIPILDEWCENRIGYRGGKWDRYHKPTISQGTSTRGSVISIIYRFKKEQDAVLFVLSHAGKYKS